MSKKTYMFYSDAGHGWLRVRIAELVELGIADKISTYSYARNGWAYLEEDCDAGLFVVTKGRDKIQFKGSNAREYSSIRSYPHYSRKSLTEA